MELPDGDFVDLTTSPARTDRLGTVELVTVLVLFVMLVLVGCMCGDALIHMVRAPGPSTSHH